MIGSHKILDLSFVHNILHRKAFLKKYREYEETAAALLRALNPDLPGKLHHAVSELNMLDLSVTRCPATEKRSRQQSAGCFGKLCAANLH